MTDTSPIPPLLTEAEWNQRVAELKQRLASEQDGFYKRRMRAEARIAELERERNSAEDFAEEALAQKRRERLHLEGQLDAANSSYEGQKRNTLAFKRERDELLDVLKYYVKAEDEGLEDHELDAFSQMARAAIAKVQP